jgi:hypothetical protein
VHLESVANVRFKNERQSLAVATSVDWRAPHLLFLLKRFGFAADCSHGTGRIKRAGAFRGAHCGDLGNAYARLITIDELDACRLECAL